MSRFKENVAGLFLLAVLIVAALWILGSVAGFGVSAWLKALGLRRFW